MISASFMNSAGSTRRGPRAIQLASPFARWPMNLSAISAAAFAP
jgi:hypothetical protein